jgi:hypothetical protein
MHLTCGNHALRCPGVPGEVCTVVPASGSRSSIRDRVTAWHRNGRPPPHMFDPSLGERVGPGGRLLDSRPAGWLGFPSQCLGRRPRAELKPRSPPTWARRRTSGRGSSGARESDWDQGPGPGHAQLWTKPTSLITWPVPILIPLGSNGRVRCARPWFRGAHRRTPAQRPAAAPRTGPGPRPHPPTPPSSGPGRRSVTS